MTGYSVSFLLYPFCIYFVHTYLNKHRKVAIRGWGAGSSEIEHISMFEALGSSTKTKELDVGVYAFVPSTKQVDAEGSLHGQFCTNQGCKVRT